MQNSKPAQNPGIEDNGHNASMTEEDREKTVANPSPGSADPGNESGDTHGSQVQRR
jgi:hypothetical protein